MFDTHCHLNFKSFKKTVPHVVEDARKAGIVEMLIPGTDYISSLRATEIASQYDKIYTSVGIHPHHVFSRLSTDKDCQDSAEYCADGINEELSLIESLVSHPSVVAIGEIGLDKHDYKVTKYKGYAVHESFLTLQKEMFIKQLRLASKHNLSIVFHNREASQDLLSILADQWKRDFAYKTVFHCCEPSSALLDFALEHNVYIGVDGDVTYDKYKQDFIKEVPLKSLVVETDSPFLLPEPLKSKKMYPNKPSNIPLIIQAVSNVKGESVDKIAGITRENGLHLFGINEHGR